MQKWFKDNKLNQLYFLYIKVLSLTIKTVRQTIVAKRPHMSVVFPYLGTNSSRHWTGRLKRRYSRCTFSKPPNVLDITFRHGVTLAL